jgi:hypothetical protein
MSCVISMPPALITDISLSSPATSNGLRHDVPSSAEETSVDISDDAILLWLIEVSPSETTLSPLAHEAITTANVVIYDRALASIVAAALPLGGYAETAASSSDAADPTMERCLRFVLDGWSVVRLVDHDKARGQQTRRTRHLAERLAARKYSDDLPVLLFMNADGGRHRAIATRLSALDIELDAAGRQGGLAISFGAIATAAGRGLRAVMSNGLAG